MRPLIRDQCKQETCATGGSQAPDRVQQLIQSHIILLKIYACIPVDLQVEQPRGDPLLIGRRFCRDLQASGYVIRPANTYWLVIRKIPALEFATSRHAELETVDRSGSTRLEITGSISVLQQVTYFHL